MYAWLPESGDTNRIARGTYGTGAGMLSGAGELFEPGKVELVGLDVSGGSEPFEFTAEFRAGDWINGSYAPAGGGARAFRGWAFTGFERGGSNVAVAGLWSPSLGLEADLPGEFEPADGDFAFEFVVESITCQVDGVLAPVNPAFAVYEAAPSVRCLVLEFPAGSVELILAVMDAATAPGEGTARWDWWSFRTNGRSRWARRSTSAGPDWRLSLRRNGVRCRIDGSAHLAALWRPAIREFALLSAGGRGAGHGRALGTDRTGYSRWGNQSDRRLRPRPRVCSHHARQAARHGTSSLGTGRWPPG